MFQQGGPPRGPDKPWQARGRCRGAACKPAARDAPSETSQRWTSPTHVLHHLPQTRFLYAPLPSQRPDTSAMWAGRPSPATAPPCWRPRTRSTRCWRPRSARSWCKPLCRCGVLGWRAVCVCACLCVYMCGRPAAEQAVGLLNAGLQEHVPAGEHFRISTRPARCALLRPVRRSTSCCPRTRWPSGRLTQRGGAGEEACCPPLCSPLPRRLPGRDQPPRHREPASCQIHAPLRLLSCLPPSMIPVPLPSRLQLRPQRRRRDKP